jgi:hypothetical protein
MRPVDRSRRPLLALPLLMAALPSRGLADNADATVLSITGPRPAAPGRESRVDFDLAALRKLRQQRLLTTTPWYSGASEFAGPLLREVLAAAGMEAAPEGTARCTALNDYRVEIPVDDALRYDVLVAHQLNGKPMSVRDKGPLFIIYPFSSQPQLRTTIYYNRCIWQLRTIALV